MSNNVARGAEDCTMTSDRLVGVIEAQEAIVLAGLDPGAVSSAAVEQAIRLTSADAAVVELVDGDELVYQAVAGMALPHQALRLAIEGSLSGACVTLGQVLVCTDAEQDPRVDRDAARRVGARSMVAVPLHYGGGTSGVLTVFSTTPDAFDEASVDSLRLIGGLLGASLGQALESAARHDLAEQHARLNQQLSGEVAERIIAEQALSITEQRLSLALDIVDLGTWDWDIVAENLVWSDNVDTIHGLEPGSFDGTYESWFALVHPEDQELVGAAVTQSLQDGEGRYDAEFRICWADGQVRWLHGRGQVYYDAVGSPVRMIGTVVDVSDRHQTEQALRRAWDEAEQAKAAAEAANAAKNDFLGRMSHELRTPLNAVLGFAQLLEMDATEEQRASVRHIRRAGVHLLDLINEVLDIARIESGQLTLSPEPVLVSEVVGEAVDLMRPLADAQGLHLSLGEGTQADRYVVADRQRIKQVLLNLLSNAVKYNRSGGHVTVSSHETGDRTALNLVVADTGLGIAAEDLERMFLPFERLGAEHTDVEGTGVGLALTQRLVQAMGGEIHVSSQVGQGSTFTVTLALVERPGEPSAEVGQLGLEAGQPSDVDEQRGARGAFHLLYIEDNASNARLLEHVVARRPEWQMTIADRGRTGLEAAQTLAAGPGVHLLLLDLHLPDMPGVDVLRHLRANPLTADTAIVVLSADATSGQVRRVQASGADRYLTKPFDVAELLDILDAVAGGPSAVKSVASC